ncbi:MAG: COX15/CtaA family protein [Burkholderiaceae bacterium]|nr:COX15/CtaA family protein [Burkholderiaceae bacterium]
MSAEVDLYNLGPLGQMLLAGLVLAVLPLAWVWRRHRHSLPRERLHALTLVTLFLTFDLVLFGAFTRLTDSGLGCPDWPGCYGHASPLGAKSDIAAAQLLLPTGPVTWGKAWVEMIHRYLATGVGALIVALTLATWWWRKHLQVSPWWATLTLVWVCIQGAFGALTVTMKLFPAIVTLHLMGGLMLLVLLRTQDVRYQHGAAWASALQGWRGVRAHRVLWWTVVALVWLQVALGGWVSTNYAVLACSDFPMCQGSWWPDMDFRHGFALWRELGETRGGDALPFEALTAIHYVHRLNAYLVLLGVCALALSLYRRADTRHSAVWLLALAVWQLLTGLSNVVLDWPLLAAVSHTGGAAALVVVLVGAGLPRQAIAPVHQTGTYPLRSTGFVA